MAERNGPLAGQDCKGWWSVRVMASFTVVGRDISTTFAGCRRTQTLQSRLKRSTAIIDDYDGCRQHSVDIIASSPGQPRATCRSPDRPGS